MRKIGKYAIRLLCLAIIGFAVVGVSFARNAKTEGNQNFSDTETPKLEKRERLETEQPQENQEDTQAMAIVEQEWERIAQLPAGELAVSGIIEPEQVNHLFFACALNEDILSRINGNSYTENENILPSQLSYLKMLYYGFDGNTYVGEMIVNQSIEAEVLQIFQTLYENNYPIEKMTLVDEYGADDERSMEDNNTSAFNYRTISGSNKLSNHSYGMAIDLNPKYNPYVKSRSDGSFICQPDNGRDYADRSKDFAYKIDENDLAYRLFTEAGFTWGGSFNSVKDYQHFEMER